MMHRVLVKLSKFDVILPLILIPWTMLIGSKNLTSTIVTTMILIIVASVIYYNLTEAMPKFFLNSVLLWLVVNLVIYEFISVETLMIYPEENWTTISLTAATCFCMFQAKRKVRKFKDVISGNKSLDCVVYCNYCEIYAPAKTVHKFWINSCVIPANKRYYLAGLGFGLWGLVYTWNIILITLCESVHLFWGYYLPRTCIGVYYTRELGLTFLCGIHQTIFSVFIFIELIRMIPFERCQRNKK